MGGRRLTRALNRLGEAGAARTLGEDTLQRCHRALGPNHVVTLWAAAGLTRALAETRDAEAAGTLARDTLQRSRAALGRDHPLTLHLLREAGISPDDVDRDTDTDHPRQPL